MECDFAEQLLKLARGLQDLWGLHLGVGFIFLYFGWPRFARGLAEIRHGTKS